MDKNTNQKEKLIFQENMGEILSNILQGYKLDETDDEVFKKMEDDKPLFGEIIMDAIRDLLFGKIQEKDLSALLQKNLNIPQNIAENLTNDVKTKIIPLIKKVPDEEPEEIMPNTPIVSTVLPKIKPPMGVAEVLEKNKQIPTPKKPMSTVIQEEKKDRPTQKIKQASGPDNYREPIE